MAQFYNIVFKVKQIMCSLRFNHPPFPSPKEKFCVCVLGRLDRKVLDETARSRKCHLVIGPAQVLNMRN